VSPFRARPDSSKPNLVRAHPNTWFSLLDSVWRFEVHVHGEVQVGSLFIFVNAFLLYNHSLIVPHNMRHINYVTLQIKNKPHLILQ
jgi:hypothetical protein